MSYDMPADTALTESAMAFFARRLGGVDERYTVRVARAQCARARSNPPAHSRRPIFPNHHICLTAPGIGRPQRPLALPALESCCRISSTINLASQRLVKVYDALRFVEAQCFVEGMAIDVVE